MSESIDLVNILIKAEYMFAKERVFKNSKQNGECLECTYKARSQSGYALVKFRRSTTGAHRVSWIAHNGKIPDGMWVLHRCNNPICVRIDHLYLGTPQENTDFMIECGRDNFQGARKHEKTLEEKAIQLRIEGRTYKEISEELKIPTGTLINYFRKINGLCAPKYPQEIRDKAFQLRDLGVQCKEIQKILNIPKRSLSRILNPR